MAIEGNGIRDRLKVACGCALALVGCLGGGAAHATPFDINVIFGGGLTPSQQAVFTQAETTWEGLITGYQSGISIPSLDINAAGLAIDGAHLFAGGNDWGSRFDVHAASVLEQQRTYVKTSRKFR